MNLEKMAEVTRLYREKLLNDPYRPRFHFCVLDGEGVPGDPNGYFYADGRHHLMYLYRRSNGTFHWGHASSADLLFWRHHQDALVEGSKDEGCFSGGAFVDDDGTAYLSYWIFNPATEDAHQGIGIAKAVFPYENWKQMEYPIIRSDKWGIIETADGKYIGCADPSNIWKKDGMYYMQTGNKAVLDAYGREADSQEIYKGDWTELFSSSNLTDWEYRGRFYDRYEGDGPEDSEDDMCPNFLPLPQSAGGGALSGKYLQLFISHNKGCQYYIGSLENEKFRPHIHGRMSWCDDTFFAPEAALDDKNRQIMFAWLRDDLPEQFQKFGWSGVFGLPRTLWLREEGDLGIAPASELKRLREGEQKYIISPQKNSGGMFELTNPDGCEINLTVKELGKEFGISIMHRENNERVLVIYNRAEGILRVDTRQSGSLNRPVLEEAPLVLAENEQLELILYIDKSVLEVFANDRQAITRRIYNPKEMLPEFGVFGDGVITELKSFRMMPTMPY